MKQKYLFNEIKRNQWRVKFVFFCNTEKSIDNSYNGVRECKQCNIKRSLKRYYEYKGNLSNQREKNYEKYRDVFFAKSK